MCAYEISLGSKKKSVDLAVLFPALLEQEIIRDSCTVDLIMMNRKVRILARYPNVVDVPRNVDGIANAVIKNLGNMKFEVAPR